jgi:FkbM family methyltransferase
MGNVYYGQQGEDCLLWSIFKKSKQTGFFIDVGALDGKRFSNTYSFELAGWSGICVEAHPNYIDLLKSNRPNSNVVHAAVSNKNIESVEFFATEIGACSTLDESVCKMFGSTFKSARTYERVMVPMKTLDAILEDVSFSGKIDVVSIDIEGAELAALRGFDLRKYVPRVLVIEAWDAPRRKALVEYMKKFGYVCARRKANNYFFCRSKKDIRRIQSAKMIGKFIRTDHPLKGKLKVKGTK